MFGSNSQMFPCPVPPLVHHFIRSKKISRIRMSFDSSLFQMLNFPFLVLFNIFPSFVTHPQTTMRFSIIPKLAALFRYPSPISYSSQSRQSPLGYGLPQSFAMIFTFLSNSAAPDKGMPPQKTAKTQLSRLLARVDQIYKKIL